MVSIYPLSIDLIGSAIASFTVVNGAGGSLFNSDQSTCVMWDPTVAYSAGGSLPVRSGQQTFNVRGVSPGATRISFAPGLHRSKSGGLALNGSPFDIMSPSVNISVRSAKWDRKYDLTGVTNHNHGPTGKWEEIRKIGSPWITPSGIALSPLKAIYRQPRAFVEAVIAIYFKEKPLALNHLLWYLDDGKGLDYNENDVIPKWIREDAGIRAALREEYNAGKREGFIEFEQENYFNTDYQNAFGAIDRVNYEFNVGAGKLSCWFKDRYEWHPVYEGFYHRFADDVRRGTNIIHAACVELKTSGAADFWMQGEATVPLELITKPQPGDDDLSKGWAQDRGTEDPL